MSVYDTCRHTHCSVMFTAFICSENNNRTRKICITKILTTMNIISFEEKTFEGMLPSLSTSCSEWITFVADTVKENLTSGWTTTMCAESCVSVRGHCRRFVITERLHSARLATRPTIVPKMLNALSGLWRIDARMPNGEVEPFDRVQ